MFGLLGVSVERCDVCRGCSVLVSLTSSKHALIAAHLLGFGAPEGGVMLRMKEVQEQSPCGAGGDLQSLGSAKPLVLVLTAAASSATRFPQTDGSSPA